MKKRIIACLLVGLLCLSVLSGCGEKKDDPGGMVTLKWAIGTYQQKDFAMVQDAVNELLPTLLPNTKIEFIFDSSMSSKWPLWMASKKEIDIAHAGYDTDLWMEIDKRSYKELDDLIDKYAPTIKAERDGPFKDQYNTARVDGKLYAIPNLQIYINDTPALGFPEPFFEYLDLDKFMREKDASPYTTPALYDVIDEYLDKVYSAGLPGTKGTNKFINVTSLFNLSKRGYAFVGGNGAYAVSNICYKVFDVPDNTVKIINFYETDEFKEFCKRARAWFEKGYISKDILTSGTPGSSSYPVNFVPRDMGEADEKGIMLMEGMSGEKTYYVALANPEQRFVGENNIGSLLTYNSIPFTAQNPERAMQLLELLRTEKGAPLLNMIIFGIEGVHYDKLSETEIRARDYIVQGNSASAYGIQNWMVSSMLNQYVIYPYTEQTRKNAIKYYYEDYPKFIRTPLAGFTFDMKSVKGMLSNVKAIVSEYEKRVASGALPNYQELHKEMNQKLATADMAKLLQNLQEQADQYIAKKR